MSKIVNITEKLEMDGNPYLVIKDEKLEVNADAATMLKIMGKYGEIEESEATPKDILDLYDLMFPEESRMKIEKLKLSFNDLTVVVMEAQKLITGAEETEGESQTHTMT
ncbi:hypothetical protein [Blautia obeum]|jgi:hypothetical protein|uniref:Uncharacterized protein n=1 Tax=Blautia obeum TaxID=40520 RepID=A0A415L5F0_9FIRM|nr:hypothetical protein [Blautia obeum]RHL43687.1 hypothetical protein DW021_15320 [Blautia obeum]DAW93113.1 MAG TPA: hypothetical protein [Bacteriophage sp.]